MVNRDYEILFPTHAIKALEALRGPDWNDFAARISQLETNDEERIAFTLLMVQLCNCASCQIDSYRAIRGCLSCAVQTIERFHGNDQELLELFAQAQSDLTQYLGVSTI